MEEDQIASRLFPVYNQKSIRSDNNRRLTIIIHKAEYHYEGQNNNKRIHGRSHNQTDSSNQYAF